MEIILTDIDKQVAEKLGVEVKPFSSEIKAAWEIAEKGYVNAVIKLKNGRWYASSYEPADENGYYEIGIYEEREDNSEAFAATAPMAICQAFLKLANIEICPRCNSHPAIVKGQVYICNSVPMD